MWIWLTKLIVYSGPVVKSSQNWFFEVSFVHQKIYLFDRRTVTSDNSERRGHLERGCCCCQSVFQLGANLENSLLLRSTERMQGKQGRFTVTEDKRNWGGWDTWHYLKDGEQFEEGSDKKGKLFGLSRMSCVLVHRLSGRRNFPKSQTASSLKPQCIAPHITQLQTTA